MSYAHDVKRCFNYIQELIVNGFEVALATAKENIKKIIENDFKELLLKTTLRIHNSFFVFLSLTDAQNSSLRNVEPFLRIGGCR